MMENILPIVLWVIFGFAITIWRLQNPQSSPEKWIEHQLGAGELDEHKLTKRFMALEEAMPLTKMRFSDKLVPNSLQKLLTVSSSHRLCHIFVGQKEGLKIWFFDWLPADANLNVGQTVIALEVPQEGLVIPPFCLGPFSLISDWRPVNQLQFVPLKHLPPSTQLYILEYDKYSSQCFQSLPAEAWHNYPAGQLLIYDGEWLAAVQPKVTPADGEKIDHYIQQLLTFYQHFFKSDPTSTLHFPSSN